MSGSELLFYILAAATVSIVGFVAYCAVIATAIVVAFKIGWRVAEHFLKT